MRRNLRSRLRALEAEVVKQAEADIEIDNDLVKSLWVSLIHWAHYYAHAYNSEGVGSEQIIEDSKRYPEHVKIGSVDPGWYTSALFYQARSVRGICDMETAILLIDLIRAWDKQGATRAQMETPQAMNLFLDLRLENEPSS